MKSNVLRFVHSPTAESGKSARAHDGAPHSAQDTPGRRGFDTPLPTIDPSFFEDGIPTSLREKNIGAQSDCTASLESMPHLLHKIQALWRTRDLNTFISHLLMDSRDGSRAGFPIEVARELLFLAKINLILRAEAAAPLLGVSLGKAAELLFQGDQAAQGHHLSADDVWANHVASTGPSYRRASTPKMPSIQNTAPPISIRLTPFICDLPPLPQAVKIDLTSPVALRSARSGSETGGIIDYGLFRCLAKELGSLHINRLVLSSQGDSVQCNWLPDGIRFARIHCRFNTVVLQVDLLNTPEDLLCQCIYEGVGHLVIYLNPASGKWRTQAQSICASDPDYFRREIARLVAFRDEYQISSGQRCEISVVHAGNRARHAMAAQLEGLEHLPGLVAYDEVVLPPGVRSQDTTARGDCHCLSPFIEAHIRTNGHLVACAMDHSGYSFTADLTTTSFSEAWNSPAFRMVRQKVARGEKAGRLCEVCPHRALTAAHS